MRDFLLKGIISTSEQQMATTDPPMATNVHFDRKYALPVVDDKTAAFALTNGAKIVDYQWIGLYDQCKKVKFTLWFFFHWLRIPIAGVATSFVYQTFQKPVISGFIASLPKSLTLPMLLRVVQCWLKFFKRWLQPVIQDCPAYSGTFECKLQDKS